MNFRPANRKWDTGSRAGAYTALHSMCVGVFCANFVSGSFSFEGVDFYI